MTLLSYCWKKRAVNIDDDTESELRSLQPIDRHGARIKGSPLSDERSVLNRACRVTVHATFGSPPLCRYMGGCSFQSVSHLDAKESQESER